MNQQLANTYQLPSNAIQQGNGRYISIFENPEEFGRRINIAQALAQTQFVPAAFRGKPEDCLVALDMAQRLNLNPLAIFPEIYVIDNKASFSSKFLIALVNGSGRFSRIVWDEGTNGKTKVKFCEWSGDYKSRSKNEWEEDVPNYYAKARFTELATGQEFESPIVDMEFANANGWTAKPGSKWRVMPQIMCAYRSASILIKRVCPEIIMGMEFAEDNMDATENPIPARFSNVEIVKRASVLDVPTEPLKIEQVKDFTDVADMLAEIERAKTEEELKKVGEKIATQQYSVDDKATLTDAYKNKRNAIRSAAKTEENKPKTTAKTVEKHQPTKKTVKQEPVPESLFEKYARDISQAENSEILNGVANMIVEDVNLTDEDRDKLYQIVDSKQMGFDS